LGNHKKPPKKLTGGQKVAGSNPVTPTIFRNEPFGENVEGLSYCVAKVYAVEPTVQTHDFEDSAFRRVICRKPLLAKRLRKFKHLDRQLGVFIAGTVQNIDLELDRRQPIPQFRMLRSERIFIDLVRQPHVEQPILLIGN
jgi:hypothetical protein